MLLLPRIGCYQRSAVNACGLYQDAESKKAAQKGVEGPMRVTKKPRGVRPVGMK